MYDLIIIGSGPAGLSASIYASRYRLKHLVVGNQAGGTMIWAANIENYPGFESISGTELAKKMEEQAKRLGGEIIGETVSKISNFKFQISNIPEFKVQTEEKGEYEARTLIAATGTRRRKLGVPGEEEFLGRGVSYCPTCDAHFFKDKIAAVIGGSNAAAMGAIHLSLLAKKVYLIYRGENLRAEPIWVERVKKEKRVETIYKTNIVKILGNNDRVAAVELDNPHRGRKILSVDGVFIEIGGVPGNELVKPLGVELDEKGFIKVGPEMATNIPGVFAAGDIANAAGELQQIVTAVSEGAIAATSVFKFLKGQ